ncbi:hypothetical protein ACJMK2_008510 [Sinanodonta woodiana]|uniref:Heat shock 70 kDa protein 12A n=1 Tax=Sinanodonta woodiana TaxID=1069815 RepID=A0ABD3VLT7_SINWO
MASLKSHKLLVAAIDFGTTFSSWAYSFKYDYDKEPTKVFVKQWNSGVGISCKAPTTALIRPDGETLHAFGYDAEDKYASLAQNNEHKDWYYFRRFKMALFKDRNLRRQTQIEDESGKKMLAMKVISLVIRYLKDDLQNELTSKLASKLPYEEEIQWVLTVPAIWNDKARSFMREAAIEAGIRNDRLLIALEPEAASIYCRHIPLEVKSSDGRTSIVPLSPGTRYIVVDAGGGTVDITIHEVMEDGNLKELHKATGGAWGGQEVDEAFKQFLIKIFGGPVFQKFQMGAIEDYIGLFRDFEVKKRKSSLDVTDYLTFTLPVSLVEIFQSETEETLTDVINQTPFAANVKVLKGNKLTLDNSLVRTFFNPAVRSVLEHLQVFYDNYDKYGISVALLVGGFSESPILSCAIKDNFPSWKVFVPHDAGLVVLMGAVLYGHDQSIIAYRVARYTYGWDSNVHFIDGKHPVEKLKVHEDGRRRCKNVFRTFLEEGSLIKHGQIVLKENRHWPSTHEQDFVWIRIYASTKKDAQYTTDESCFFLGKLTVGGLDMSLPREERTAEFTITHESTNLNIRAINAKSRQELEASIDLLK